MRLAAAVTVLALVLAGCAAGGASSRGGTTIAPTASAAIPAALVAFYSQTAAWRDCGPGHDCADVTVPLDYAAPAGARLTRTMTRVRATASPRLGTLFVNPGGPGVSPAGLGDWFDRTGLARYDVVEWDPRGVGVPAVTCLDAAATSRYTLTDFSPDTPAEEAALASAERSFGDACLARTGRSMLAHVATSDDARDLDILRAAVGDARLTFYGASYGTLLGALYAEFFPTRVGRVVLDSPVDLTGASPVAQSAGLESAFHAFVRWCAGGGDCPWGGAADAAFGALASWLRSLDAAPVRVGGRELTQSEAALGVAALLYGGRPEWPALRSALRAAQGGDGAALLAAADADNGRRADGSYSSLLAAGAATLCADQPRRSRTDADATWARDRQAAPLFGELWGPDLLCTAWPEAARPWVTPHGVGASPILVVGATGDPGTPYAWAQTAVRTLASGRLLTFAGDGHVSYGGRSTCVDAAVRAYLTAGTSPAPGTSCS